MNPAYISALAALAGSVIGGLTSFLTSWMTQQTQTRAQLITAEIAKREALYGKFIDEASRLLTDALENQRESLSQFVTMHATLSRMRLVSSPAVIEAAEHAGHVIAAEYLAPNRTAREAGPLIEAGELDPLRAFSEACREELRLLGPGDRLQPSRRAHRAG